MTTEQRSSISEAGAALEAATKEYKFGTAMIDLLETAALGLEEHVSRAGELGVDDMRRLPEHLLRVGELVLRLQGIYDELNRQIFENVSGKDRYRGGH